MSTADTFNVLVSEAFMLQEDQIFEMSLSARFGSTNTKIEMRLRNMEIIINNSIISKIY